MLSLLDGLPIVLLLVDLEAVARDEALHGLRVVLVNWDDLGLLKGFWCRD